VDLASVLQAGDFGQLIHALQRPQALVELSLVLASAAVAWLLVRLLRGAAPASEDSIWFGRRVVDGVFFPVLVLLLALLVRWGLHALGHPVALFKLMVPLLVALVVIRLTVRVLHQAFPNSGLMRVVERSVSWLAWVAMALWVTGLLPLILAELDGIGWKIGGTHITVRNLIEGAISAVLVLVLTLWLSAALEAKLLKGATDNLSIRKMAANALRALLLLVGLMFALSAAGIDLTALGVLGGALGVGIGLGLQKLAANYVSGFVILAERSMNIGDVVKVDGFEGTITDISTRYSVIRALNGRESIVPNEMMITQRIENSSLADPKVAISSVVQVAYGTDLGVLMPRMLQVVSQVPRVITEPGPSVLLSNFAADGLELTVAFWIQDPEKGQLGPRSEVNLALLKLFNEMGVEIPFPQRVVRQLPG
jgi:small-conductance mechanosensitive channel